MVLILKVETIFIKNKYYFEAWIALKLLGNIMLNLQEREILYDSD